MRRSGHEVPGSVGSECRAAQRRYRERDRFGRRLIVKRDKQRLAAIIQQVHGTGHGFRRRRIGQDDGRNPLRAVGHLGECGLVSPCLLDNESLPCDGQFPPPAVFAAVALKRERHGAIARAAAGGVYVYPLWSA